MTMNPQRNNKSVGYTVENEIITPLLSSQYGDDDNDAIFEDVDIGDNTIRDYNPDDLALHVSRTSRWIVIIAVKTGIWVSVLIAVCLIYPHYVKKCEPRNTFTEFSLCLIIYIIMQLLVDLILAVVANRKMKKLICMDIPGNINSVKKLEPKEYSVLNDQDVNQSQLNKTIEMGKYIRQERLKQKMLKKALSPTTERKPKRVSRKMLDDAMLTMNNMAKLNYEDAPSSRNKRDKSMISTGGKILVGLNTVPMLSIFFFFVVGVDTFTEIKSYRADLGEKELSSVCLISYGLNCAILVVCLLQSVLRSIPVFLLSIQRVKSETINQYHEAYQH